MLAAPRAGGGRQEASAKAATTAPSLDALVHGLQAAQQVVHLGRAAAGARVGRREAALRLRHA